MSNNPPPPVADRGALLDEWVATRAEIARLEGRAAALLASRASIFVSDVREEPQHRDVIRRSMIAEYAAAGHLSKGTVEFQFADAESLSAELPGLQAALAAGTITAQHVRVLVAAAAPIRDAVANGALPAETFALYEAAVLAIAEHESPSRTRVQARLIAATLAGESLRDRHERAVKDRSVTVRPLEDGFALLTAVLPEVYAVAIKDRLSQLAGAIAAAACGAERTAAGEVFGAPTDASTDAEDWDPNEWIGPEDLDPSDPRLEEYQRSVLAAGTTYVIDPEQHHRDDTGVELVAADGRTRRQIEADVLTDLLLASNPSAVLGTGLDRIAASVQVTIAATTLAGEDDLLAELDGHGPLHPDTARELARLATGWNRLFLDHAGMVTKVDRYTPSKGMKRFLQARDQRCRFPGCHAAAARCEIDHNFDYAKGGLTEINNLCCFCTAHHPLKHPDTGDVSRWYAHQLPDGTLRWASPLGRTYDDPVPRRVMFV